MNGVTGSLFQARIPTATLGPAQSASHFSDLHKRLADVQRKHELEEARRRAMSVAPVTGSV
jgi:hypothetical protein